MVFLLFQMTSGTVVVPNYAEMQFTLPSGRLDYAIKGEPLHFTMYDSEFDFTIRED